MNKTPLWHFNSSLFHTESLNYSKLSGEHEFSVDLCFINSPSKFKVVWLIELSRINLVTQVEQKSHLLSFWAVRVRFLKGSAVWKKYKNTCWWLSESLEWSRTCEQVDDTSRLQEHWAQSCCLWWQRVKRKLQLWVFCSALCRTNWETRWCNVQRVYVSLHELLRSGFTPRPSLSNTLKHFQLFSREPAFTFTRFRQNHDNDEDY